ncbi:hypothetical protein BKA70DRAFT_1398675 [Coprinopsis sp. MPI-PUGE-AT-0042]|nr:hypothetical protein BKA70DRAFT_1398675 [Coprinopsis sp. MPI-PUGE-AT-0042]
MLIKVLKTSEPERSDVNQAPTKPKRFQANSGQISHWGLPLPCSRRDLEPSFAFVKGAAGGRHEAQGDSREAPLKKATLTSSGNDHAQALRITTRGMKRGTVLEDFEAILTVQSPLLFYLCPSAKPSTKLNLVYSRSNRTAGAERLCILFASLWDPPPSISAGDHWEPLGVPGCRRTIGGSHWEISGRLSGATGCYWALLGSPFRRSSLGLTGISLGGRLPTAPG